MRDNRADVHQPSTPIIRIQTRNIKKIKKRPLIHEDITEQDSPIDSFVPESIEVPVVVPCEEDKSDSTNTQAVNTQPEDHLRQTIKALQKHTQKSFHLVVWALFYEGGSILNAYLLLIGRKSYPSWNHEIDFEILQTLQENDEINDNFLSKFYYSKKELMERSSFLYKLTRLI